MNRTTHWVGLLTLSLAMATSGCSGGATGEYLDDDSWEQAMNDEGAQVGDPSPTVEGQVSAIDEEVDTPETGTPDDDGWVLAIDDEVIEFDTQQELLDHLVGTEHYEPVLSKFQNLAAARRLALEDGVVGLEPDDQRVAAFSDKLSANLEVPYSGNGTLFKDNNLSGYIGPTLVPVPAMTRKTRNTASSILYVGAAPTVLCDKTWWRGKKVTIAGVLSRNLSDFGFDNRTESFF